MRIEIAERLHPFSHLPGTRCLLPKSGWQLHIFPTLVRLKGKEELEIILNVVGPVKNFTVEQDLEKGHVSVFGQTVEGFLRYRLVQSEKAVEIHFEKLPKGEMHIDLPSGKILVKENQTQRICASLPCALDMPPENLSLGMHRSQDWEMVSRRGDLREILPIWFRLGQLLPPAASEKYAGTALILDQCRKLIENSTKEDVCAAFVNLFQAGFQGILAPRLIDDQYQGLVVSNAPVPQELSPLILLTEGQKLIRALFFQENEGRIALLPCLPPEFHAGRLLGIKRSNGDRIAIEWSKKLLRRVIWNSASEQTLQLSLQKSLHSFRMRRSLKDKGERISCDRSLALHAGETIYLDQFQK